MKIMNPFRSRLLVFACLVPLAGCGSENRLPLEALPEAAPARRSDRPALDRLDRGWTERALAPALHRARNAPAYVRPSRRLASASAIEAVLLGPNALVLVITGPFTDAEIRSTINAYTNPFPPPGPYDFDEVTLALCLDLDLETTVDFDEFDRDLDRPLKEIRVVGAEGAAATRCPVIPTIPPVVTWPDRLQSPGFLTGSFSVSIEGLRLEHPGTAVVAVGGGLHLSDVEVKAGGIGVACLGGAMCEAHGTTFEGVEGDGIGFLCNRASCFGSDDRFTGLRFGFAGLEPGPTVLLANTFQDDVETGVVALDPLAGFFGLVNDIRAYRDGFVFLSDHATEVSLLYNRFHDAGNSAVQIDAPATRALISENTIDHSGSGAAGIAIFRNATTAVLGNSVLRASPGLFLGPGAGGVLVGPNRIVSPGSEAVVDQSPDTDWPFSVTSNTVCTGDVEQDGRPEAWGDLYFPPGFVHPDLLSYRHGWDSWPGNHDFDLIHLPSDVPHIHNIPAAHAHGEVYVGTDEPAGFVTPSAFEAGDAVVIDGALPATIFAVDGPGGTLSTNPPIGNPGGPYRPRKDEVGVLGVDTRAVVLGHAHIAGVRMGGFAGIGSDEVVVCSVPVVVVEIVEGPFRDRIVAVLRATRMRLEE